MKAPALTVWCVVSAAGAQVKTYFNKPEATAYARRWNRSMRGEPEKYRVKVRRFEAALTPARRR